MPPAPPISASAVAPPERHRARSPDPESRVRPLWIYGRASARNSSRRGTPRLPPEPRLRWRAPRPPPPPEPARGKRLWRAHACFGRIGAESHPASSARPRRPRGPPRSGAARGRAAPCPGRQAPRRKAATRLPRRAEHQGLSRLAANAPHPPLEATRAGAKRQRTTVAKVARGCRFWARDARAAHVHPRA